MTEKQESITEDEFKKIFSCRRVRELLLMNIAAYPIIYHFMNYFIANRLFKKREHVPSHKHLSFIKFNDINRALKTSFFYIKSFLEKNETLKIGLDILFFSRDRFIEINTEEGKINSDYLFWSVIRAIKKNHPDCKMVMISTNDKPMPQIDDIRLYSLIQYCTPLIFLRSILFGTAIYLKWKLSRSKIIMYLRDNNCECTVSLFDDFFGLIRLFFLLIRDYTLQNVLTKTNPKVIMANDDVLQLKPNNLENTKFIIMQSASIDEMNEKYKKMFLSTFPLDKLIADYFLVSGPKFKDMKKDAKDSEEMIVTGQPRYDILANADKIFDKKKLCVRYNLDLQKKITLIITENLPMFEDNVIFLANVFKSIKKISDIQIVVKPHPDEKNKWYEEVVKEQKVKALILPKKSDTLEVIYSCDVMLAFYSTTILEAIILNKPVVVINLTNRPDPRSYVDDDVALGAYNTDDIAHMVKKALYDKEAKDLLKKARTKFIYKYYYSIDGKASERVANLIVQMIEESKRKEKRKL